MSGGADDTNLGGVLEIFKLKDALPDVSGYSSLAVSTKV
jgi:hypothetical protein